jgi:CubicO group peptidase (beta-lactamase class C family)
MKVLIEKKDAAGNVTREPVSAERPITVQDLLRHTSGFAYADNAPFPELKDAYTKADIDSLETDVSPDELVQRLAGIPLAWQPGTRWQYGVSTDVLGVLLERLTGKRLDFLLEEMIFTPLDRRNALRRNLAVFRSRMTSSRARHRSRIASSSTWGT